MKALDYHQWHSSSHDDEPRDQRRDLRAGDGAYWAEIGPDERQKPGGWSWTVIDFDAGNEDIASGFADDEASAKQAVDEWEAAHAPGPRSAPC